VQSAAPAGRAGNGLGPDCVERGNHGDPTVGSTLSGSYAYADATATCRGLHVPLAAQQAPIAGATAATYLLAVADEGASVVFEVTPVAATGTPRPKCSAERRCRARRGRHRRGTRGSSVVSPARQPWDRRWTVRTGTRTAMATWRRVNVPLAPWRTAIAGATSDSYTLVAADEGATIAFEVTPVSATGAPRPVRRRQAPRSGLLPRPPALHDGKQRCDRRHGHGRQQLTGTYTYGDVDGDLQARLRTGASRREPITGATAVTYTLSAPTKAEVSRSSHTRGGTGTPTTGTAS